MIDNAELTDAVAELTRDVERLDAILDIERYLLEQRTPNEENAKRQWRQIRAGLGRLTARTRDILDQIAQPNSRRLYAMAGGRDRLAGGAWRTMPPLSRPLPPRSR
jgi:FixJ family two-component response regulator